MQTCIIAHTQTLTLNKYFDENKCENVSRLNEEFRRKKLIFSSLDKSPISNVRHRTRMSLLDCVCFFLYQYEEGSKFALLILISVYKYLSIIILKQLPIHQHV